MPSLLDPPDPTQDTSKAGGLLGLDMPRIQQPDDSGTDQGAALADLYTRVMAEHQRQMQISRDQGAWTGGEAWEGGHPTQQGALDAIGQYANALLMGTTAPGGKGITAYHGSQHDFEKFDTSKLHPDEAGHYFAQDEKMAADYAGRSSRDPAAGHMYEVNIRADPAQFLDYGSLHPTDQAALNDPGAVQKLRDAGVPGIKFPDGTHVVFDANTIDILRKYGIAGLGLGLSAAAATDGSQQPPMAQ